MKGNSRRLRTYAECVSTQPELDVDMDAVAARETVTEIVTETETATERDNAFVAFGLFGVCWWQRQTAKATANALRCCKLVLSCKRPQGARDTLASQHDAAKQPQPRRRSARGGKEKSSPHHEHILRL